MASLRQWQTEDAMVTMIPETSPDFDRTRVIERPDGFYWQDKETDQTYGPFASLWDAIEDMNYNADAECYSEDVLEAQDAEPGLMDFGEEGLGEDHAPIDFDRL
jgi:hypothetical protein